MGNDSKGGKMDPATAVIAFVAVLYIAQSFFG